jgi:hypothetical protein
MSHAPDTILLRAPNVADRKASAADTQGFPKDRLGIPVHYYWRAMVGATKYSHPKLDEIEFSRKDLTDADRYTREMIADGSKPYLPLGHSNKTDNQGFIWDAKFDGKFLWGLHGFVGDRALENAAKHETSVCLRRNWKGGNGKVYPIIVEHNALVPDPVAMGLPDYVALSRDGGVEESVPVYSPSAEGTHHMPTAEQLAAARTLLGRSETDLPDDQVFDTLLECVECSRDQTFQALEDAEQFKKDCEEQAVQMSRKDEDLHALRTQLVAVKNDVVTLSRTAAPVVDPEALADRADVMLSRCDLAVERGDMPKFVADKLKAWIRPADGQPDVFMLSRSEAMNARPAEAILRLFEGSKMGQKLGEDTGPQTLVPMSRGEPGGGPPAEKRVNPYEDTIKALTGTPGDKAA